MRATTILAAAAATLAGTAAQAQTYVGVSGGLTIPRDSRNEGSFKAAVPATAAFPAIPAGTALAWRTEFDKGYDLSAHIGHRFEGGFRLEAQVDFSRSGIDTHRNLTVGGANIDGADVAILTRGPASAANPRVGQVLNSGIGSQRSFGAFANAFYDFGKGTIQPYVGGGIGVQRLRFDYRPSNVNVGRGSDTNFAWQAMGGVTARAIRSVEFFAQYTYRDSGSTTFRLSLLPADLKARGRQSIVSAGFRFPLN